MQKQTKIRIRLFTLMLTIVAIAVGIFWYQVQIDAFGVWGSAVHRGVNNRKSGQFNMDRVFKPYQYEIVQPEIVIVGTSLVEYGIPPVWPNTPSSKLYNFGLGTLTFSEMTRYTGQILKTHKPKTIIFGFDLLQFSMHPKKFLPGFSQERLDAISMGKPFSTLFKLKETVFCFDAIRKARETRAESQEQPGERYFDSQGWFVKYGAFAVQKEQAYRARMWRHANNYYSSLKFTEKTFDKVEKHIRSLKKRGIEVLVYVCPYSADLQLAMTAQNQWKNVETMKRRLSAIAPVWDFANINSVTRRRANFPDGSHHTGMVGSMIMSRLSGASGTSPMTAWNPDESIAVPGNRPFEPMLITPPPDFGQLLTPDTIERSLAKDRVAFDAWKAKNTGIYKAFAESGKKPNKAKFMKATKGLFSMDGVPPKPSASPKLPAGTGPSQKQVQILQIGHLPTAR